MKRLIAGCTMLLLLMNTAGVAAAGEHHIQRTLHPVGGSGVEGIVNLVQRPHNGGTHITLVAFGLQPGSQHISLYYDNHVCHLEPYSLDDVIGGIYTANAGGVGTTEANVHDNLDEINSVSVRTAGDFRLLACADVHPNHP